MGLTADIYDIFGFTNHVISEAAGAAGEYNGCDNGSESFCGIA